MAINKEKDQKFLLLGLLFFSAVGFALAGVALGLSFDLGKFSLFKPQAKVTPAPQPTIRAVFSLDPAEATKMRGEKLEVSLVLENVEEEISGVAARINCSWGKEQIPVPSPVEFIDAQPAKPGVQLEVSQELINAGWQFPVNQIISQEGTNTLDLAAVYISPEGYKMEKMIVLGNFSFKTVLGDQTLSCNFDPWLTKITTKTGEEILLNFKKGNYLVLEK